MRLAQGHNMVPPVGIEPMTSIRSPMLYHYATALPVPCRDTFLCVCVPQCRYERNSLIVHFASYSVSIAILKFATHGKYNKCLCYILSHFLELSFRNYYLSMQ